ncbi:MAG TPA: YqeG family HAD IIIA-type phosphatase [Clostridiales bacterium]|nr:YqeG family HAD IIIA-type phosphatase [Clostridiales bacterium]
MRSLLKPGLSVGSIFDINLQSLWDSGYRNMIIDVDNTITAWNNYTTNPKLKNWVLQAKNTGFSICLLSNNNQTKVKQFALELGVIAAPKGGKPFSRAFQSALAVLRSTKHNTLVIGDQVFTDILGGNRAGLFTILVDPIDSREFIGTRLTRVMERLLAGRRPICKSQHQQK